jgi:hypothetical protein
MSPFRFGSDIDVAIKNDQLSFGKDNDVTTKYQPHSF